MPAKKNAPKKRYIRRKRTNARPMKSIGGYRNVNSYRFCRETLPTTTSFTIIPAGTSYPAMGYLNFDNLQLSQLVNVNEFAVLFARYHVDKIITCLTPMFQMAVSSTSSSGSTTGLSSNLRTTKVSTKWLNQSFNIGATADAQLEELAQLQAKSKGYYAAKRCIYLTTINPRVSQKGVLNASGTEISVNKPMPWLNIAAQASVPLTHNSLIFAERIDGSDLDANWKFRVCHKIYFRCSQVG